MVKKSFISTILLFAFSFMLIHNIIPHHHYNEASEISNHHHHDDIAGANNHEHHHRDTKEKAPHDKSDEPVSFFTHITHLLISNEVVFNNIHKLQKTQNVKQFVLNTYLAPKFTGVNLDIKRKPPNYRNVIPILPFLYTNFLRGPPALSV